MKFHIKRQPTYLRFGGLGGKARFTYAGMNNKNIPETKISAQIPEGKKHYPPKPTFIV